MPSFEPGEEPRREDRVSKDGRVPPTEHGGQARQLSRLMSALAGCTEFSRASRLAVEAARACLGAAGGTFLVFRNSREGPRLDPVEDVGAGLLPASLSGTAAWTLLDAARSGQACVAEGDDWRALDPGEPAVFPRGWLAVPPGRMAEPPGILALRFDRPQPPEPQRLQMAIAIAAAAGLAVERLEQARRHREEHPGEDQLRRMFNTPLLGLLLSGPDGRFHEANDTFLQLTGYTREDLERGTVGQEALTPPEWQGRMREAELELQTHGVAPPFEMEYRRKDGRRVPVLVGIVHLARWRQNLSFALDISGRHRVVEELRFLSEASLHLADLADPDAALQRVAELAATSICTFALVDMVQEDGTLRRVAATHRWPSMAPLMRELMWYPPLREGTRSTSLATLHTTLARAIDRAMRARAAQDPEHAALIERLKPLSGLTVPMLSEGKAIGLISLYSAGMDPPLGESDVQVGEELARRAVAALENARLLQETREQAGLQRLLVDISRSYEELQSNLGPVLDKVARSVSTILGDLSVLQLLDSYGELKLGAVGCADPPLADSLISLLGSGRRPGRQLADLVVATGQPLVIADLSAPGTRQKYGELLAPYDAVRLRALLLVPLRAQGRIIGTLCAGRLDGVPYTPRDLRFVRAIADRAALVIANAQLLEASRSAVRLRDDFLSIASHELKTPLTPLTLAVQSLRVAAAGEADSPFQDRLRGRLRLMERQIQRLTVLINDLLDVSRIAKGSLELRPGEMDLAAVVSEAVEGFREEAAQRGSRVELEGVRKLWGWWDRSRVEQVATNLLSNAIKYGDGKPVHVRLEEQAGQAVLTVKDQGIGIEPETLPHIFERFVRARSGRHFGGLGLGLYITHEVVVAHGGTVAVESELGRGSTFTVRLPMRAAHAG